MSLDECFAANQGKALLVPGGGAGNEGQCVQWADTVLHDVYGLPYVYANAIDWWSLPQSLAGNFTQVTDGSIKKGDFVIFNQKVGSVYGHIDIAMSDGSVNGFTGADSNWGGNKTVHLVNHSGQAGYIIGSLRPKGANKKMLSEDDFYRVFRGMLGRDPTQAEAKNFSRDPAVVIDTLWNNGSEQRYNDSKNPNAAQQKLDQIKGIVNS